MNNNDDNNGQCRRRQRRPTASDVARAATSGDLLLFYNDDDDDDDTPSLTAAGLALVVESGDVHVWHSFTALEALEPMATRYSRGIVRQLFGANVPPTVGTSAVATIASLINVLGTTGNDCVVAGANAVGFVAYAYERLGLTRRIKDVEEYDTDDVTWTDGDLDEALVDGIVLGPEVDFDCTIVAAASNDWSRINGNDWRRSFKSR
jgi:hypothetical protein